MQFLDENGVIVNEYKGKELSTFMIDNVYINKVKGNQRSLVFPLGSKAKISIDNKMNSKVTKVKLIDISGLYFESSLPMSF